MNKILQMLQLQQELNDATNGSNWEKGLTKNGKKIDWRRCTYLECAELIESYPWKHWKAIDALADYDNIKIEVVDIWHFLMSEALKEYQVKNLGSIEDLALNITQLNTFNNFNSPIKNVKRDNFKEIEEVEELVKNIFNHGSIEKIMEIFLKIAIQSELNLETLYKLYIGKNILNRFRQDHGYKEGTYIKIWKGKEDNVIMQTILEEKKEITPLELYNALKEAYPIKS